MHRLPTIILLLQGTLQHHHQTLHGNLPLYHVHTSHLCGMLSWQQIYCRVFKAAFDSFNPYQREWRRIGLELQKYQWILRWARLPNTYCTFCEFFSHFWILNIFFGGGGRKMSSWIVWLCDTARSVFVDYRTTRCRLQTLLDAVVEGKAVHGLSIKCVATACVAMKNVSSQQTREELVEQVDSLKYNGSHIRPDGRCNKLFRRRTGMFHSAFEKMFLDGKISMKLKTRLLTDHNNNRSSLRSVRLLTAHETDKECFKDWAGMKRPLADTIRKSYGHVIRNTRRWPARIMATGDQLRHQLWRIA